MIVSRNPSNKKLFDKIAILQSSIQSDIPFLVKQIETWVRENQRELTHVT